MTAWKHKGNDIGSCLTVLRFNLSKNVIIHLQLTSAIAKSTANGLTFKLIIFLTFQWICTFVTDQTQTGASGKVPGDPDNNDVILLLGSWWKKNPTPRQPTPLTPPRGISLITTTSNVFSCHIHLIYHCKSWKMNPLYFKFRSFSII